MMLNGYPNRLIRKLKTSKKIGHAPKNLNKDKSEGIAKSFLHF